MNTVLLWFRQDLRLDSNPALVKAVKDKLQIVPVYIHAPEEAAPWDPGAASNWWLHQSLHSLATSLKAAGSALILRSGPSISALNTLLDETGAQTVYCNRLYEPAMVERDQRVRDALLKRGVNLQILNGNLFHEVGSVLNQSGQPYRVFTPFYRNCIKLGIAVSPTPAPKSLPKLTPKPRSLKLADLDLLPRPAWYASLATVWQPGEAGAAEQLKQTCAERLGDYPTARDFPAQIGTSRLSAHLHYGEISVQRILYELIQAAEQSRSHGWSTGKDALVREVIWRDFAHHVLHFFPHTTDKPFDERFTNFKWKRSDKKILEAWHTGTTGFPVIDAGMRELWHTGWMHNRVRMIVASFLTKNAGIHWKTGARWFWDTLVDADLANNSLNWQWVAGCGVDAAPYFRIFNPVTQSRKFDPRGEYLSRWIPELKSLPDRYIHEPWAAPAAVLEEHGVTLGKNYPKPVLDLATTRQAALARYQTYIKQANRN